MKPGHELFFFVSKEEEDKELKKESDVVYVDLFEKKGQRNGRTEITLGTYLKFQPHHPSIPHSQCIFFASPETHDE